MKKKIGRPQFHDQDRPGIGSDKTCRWCRRKVGPVYCPICKEPVGYASTIEKEGELLGRHNRKAHKRATRDARRVQALWEKFRKDHGVDLWFFHQ